MRQFIHNLLYFRNSPKFFEKLELVKTGIKGINNKKLRIKFMTMLDYQLMQLHFEKHGYDILGGQNTEDVLAEMKRGNYQVSFKPSQVSKFL